jgi:Zn-dependent M28 family amino/carboxypeptidase
VPIASAAPLFSGSGHSVEELTVLAKSRASLPTLPLTVSIRATTVTHIINTYQAESQGDWDSAWVAIQKDDYLVLTAHLDHLGVGRPVNGDSIYHGAMDNASGIASLIETAKALAAGLRPRRSIVFIAFTGKKKAS